MDRREAMAAAIRERLDRYGAVIDEADRALATAQALEIIAAVLWLNGCRAGSAAQVYALDSLAGALGRPLLTRLHGLCAAAGSEADAPGPQPDGVEGSGARE